MSSRNIVMLRDFNTSSLLPDHRGLNICYDHDLFNSNHELLGQYPY